MSKNFQQTPKFGICIDWETTGVEWGGDSSIKYQGISFGVIVFNTNTFDAIEKMYCEIKFNSSKYLWTDSAEKIHGLSREYLEENGITQEEAAEKLLELLAKYFAGSKVMLMGHNCEFDRRFTNQLLNTIGVEFNVEKSGKFETFIEIHHVKLDTSAIGFVTLGLFKSDLIFEALCLPAREKHNALEDANMTLETCKTIKLLVQHTLKNYEN